MPDAEIPTLAWEVREITTRRGRILCVIFGVLLIAQIVPFVLHLPFWEGCRIVSNLLSLLMIPMHATMMWILLFVPTRYAIAPEGAVTRSTGTNPVSWSVLRRGTLRHGIVSFGRAYFWSDNLVLPRDPEARTQALALLKSHLPEGLVE